MHLYLALLLHKDYFDRSVASLSCPFAPQGLFRPASCISIWLFCSTGIISTGQMHLYHALLLHWDYFAPVGCISILLFCSTGIISTCQIEVLLEFLIFFQLLHFYFSFIGCRITVFSLSGATFLASLRYISWCNLLSVISSTYP